MTATAVAVFCLGMAGLGALAVRLRSLSGTTLVAPWFWTLLALGCVAGVEFLLAINAQVWAEAAAVLRYLAAMSTFLPLMAVLGAKRPQDRGWQFIVLTLWGILSLPGLEWWVYGGEGPLELHPARSWFLALLIFLGAANYLPTRYWPSSLLFAASQVILMQPWLPGLGERGRWASPALGLGLAVAAMILVSAGWPRLRTAASLDRVWLDFRDRFGALWGLRIAERMNASATRYGWHVTLGWGGFFADEGHAGQAVPPEVHATVRESLAGLLRRFVSPEWIAVRLGPVESEVVVDEP